MIKKLFISIGVMSLLAPSLVIGSACIDIPNRIYLDIKQHPSAIYDQHFKWKDVNWLTRQLGNPTVEKISANKIKYSWLCDADSPVLSVIVDKKERRLTYITGQYNFDSGSGIFSRALVRANKKPTTAQAKMPPPGVLSPEYLIAVAQANRQAQMNAMPPAPNPPIVPNQTSVTNQTLPTVQSAPTVQPTLQLISTNQASSSSASCQSAIQLISADTKKYNLGITSKIPNLSWMSLGWLQAALGPAQATTSSDKLYIWDTFRLLVLANGSKEFYGNLPKTGQVSGGRIPTLDDAIRAYGKPKNIIETPLNTYTWHCDTNSTLSVAIDKNGLIMSLDYNLCQNNVCKAASVHVRHTEAEDQMKQ